MGITHLSGLDVSGTTTLSGAFTVTASGKQTTLTKLSVSGTVQLSGKVTATGTGKLTTLNALTVSNTSTLNGIFIQTGGKNFRIGSAANGVSGVKSIAAASSGSGLVTTNKALASSRILLTAVGQETYRALSTNIATISSGTNFKIRLYRFQTAGTLATASGKVAWQIVNK